MAIKNLIKKNKRGLELVSYQSLFGLLNMFRKNCFGMIYHIGSFNDFIQRGLSVNPKNTLPNYASQLMMS